MKKLIFVSILLLLFTGCGNQWYKRYTGIKLESSSDCYIKIDNKGNMIDKLTDKGYNILGTVYKEYTNKHEKYVIHACKRVGASFTVYDVRQQTMYFME